MFVACLARIQTMLMTLQDLTPSRLINGRSPAPVVRFELSTVLRALHAKS
jgi:hypothetical protein